MWGLPQIGCCPSSIIKALNVRHCKAIIGVLFSPYILFEFFYSCYWIIHSNRFLSIITNYTLILHIALYYSYDHPCMQFTSICYKICKKDLSCNITWVTLSITSVDNCDWLNISSEINENVLILLFKNNRGVKRCTIFIIIYVMYSSYVSCLIITFFTSI